MRSRISFVKVQVLRTRHLPKTTETPDISTLHTQKHFGLDEVGMSRILWPFSQVSLKAITACEIDIKGSDF